MSNAHVWQLLTALIVARVIYLKISEYRARREYFVTGERSPFTGMNTGAPGHTDLLIIGEMLTLRQAKKIANRWTSNHPWGAATVYQNDSGVCSEPSLKRWNSWN